MPKNGHWVYFHLRVYFLFCFPDLTDFILIVYVHICWPQVINKRIVIVTDVPSYLSGSLGGSDRRHGPATATTIVITSPQSPQLPGLAASIVTL